MKIIYKQMSKPEDVKVEIKVKVEDEPKVADEPKVTEATKSETMDRVSSGCMTCGKTAATACKLCIGCWRCTLNCCEAIMDINIRCCTCAKSCLERIDCDETP
jgi:hypothetical protein